MTNSCCCKTNQEAVVLARAILKARWPTPTPRDSFDYVVQEIGEVSDAMMRAGYGDKKYARQNERETDLEMEIGDVAVMLCTLATSVGIDMEIAVDKSLSKFMKKFGGNDEDDSQD